MSSCAILQHLEEEFGVLEDTEAAIPANSRRRKEVAQSVVADPLSLKLPLSAVDLQREEVMAFLSQPSLSKMTSSPPGRKFKMSLSLSLKPPLVFHSSD